VAATMPTPTSHSTKGQTASKLQQLHPQLGQRPSHSAFSERKRGDRGSVDDPVSGARY